MADPIILNLTGRPVLVNDIEIDAQPNAARCNTSNEILEQISIDGFPAHISRRVFGEVFGLPEPIDGVLYLVNQDVATALPRRADLLVLGKPSRGSTLDNRRHETFERRSMNVILSESRAAIEAIEVAAKAEKKPRQKSTVKLPAKRKVSRSKRAK